MLIMNIHSDVCSIIIVPLVTLLRNHFIDVVQEPHQCRNTVSYYILFCARVT